MISPNLTSLEILALEELNRGIQPSADMAKCLCKEKLASAAYRSGTGSYRHRRGQSILNDTPPKCRKVRNDPVATG